MKTVSVSQLVSVLRAIGHACPIGFSAMTDARPRKTGNPFVGIAKLSKVSAFTGADWEASVNRQLAREDKAPTFEQSERQWGVRVSPALIEKDGSFYLVAQVQHARTTYLAKRASGQSWQIVNKDTVRAFLPPSRPAAVGTDKGLFYRNYSLANLARVTVRGETYRIRH